MQICSDSRFSRAVFSKEEIDQSRAEFLFIICPVCDDHLRDLRPNFIAHDGSSYSVIFPFLTHSSTSESLSLYLFPAL